MKSKERLLFWAPRVLAILHAAFLSSFAFDVFGTGSGFWATLGTFLLHLAPTWIILLALWVAWNSEYAGGWIFMVTGAFFLFRYARGQNFLSMALITWPFFIIAALFLVHDRQVRRKK